eukprot:797334-Pyramimonas_sp.AAC.1
MQPALWRCCSAWPSAFAWFVSACICVVLLNLHSRAAVDSELRCSSARVSFEAESIDRSVSFGLTSNIH